ncbi:unnamed protein product [Gordionus sp. m RMFG-2023]
MNIGDPRIECDSDQIRLIFNLLNPFNGILYPKNSYNHGEGNCSLIGKGMTSLEYRIPLYGCGTISIQQEDGSINFRNVIVLQNHNMLVTSSDRAYHIDCHYPLQEKVITSNANISMITTIGVLTGVPELPEPIMTIHVGKTPEGPLISGFVSLGSFLTLKIKLMDESVYGFTVHSCFARDGLNWGEQLLIDASGCPVNPAVFGNFQYDNVNPRNRQPSDTVTRAFVMFASHKFPTSNSVYYECIVKLCPKNNCKIPICSSSILDVTNTAIIDQSPTRSFPVITNGLNTSSERITELINITNSNTISAAMVRTTTLVSTSILPKSPQTSQPIPQTTQFKTTTLSSVTTLLTSSASQEKSASTPLSLSSTISANSSVTRLLVFATTSLPRIKRSVKDENVLIDNDAVEGEQGEEEEPEIKVKGSVIILDDVEDEESLTTEEGFKFQKKNGMGKKEKYTENAGLVNSDDSDKFELPNNFKYSDQNQFILEEKNGLKDKNLEIIYNNNNNLFRSKGSADNVMKVYDSTGKEFCMSTAVFSVGIAIFVCIFLMSIIITSFLCLKTRKNFGDKKKSSMGSLSDPYFIKYQMSSNKSSPISHSQDLRSGSNISNVTSKSEMSPSPKMYSNQGGDAKLSRYHYSGSAPQGVTYPTEQNYYPKYH